MLEKTLDLIREL